MSHQTRFGVVLARIATDTGIPHAAFRLYAVLATYADLDGLCWPSVTTLATALGVSERAVQQHMAVLVEQGLVTRENRSAEGLTTITRLTDLHHEARLHPVKHGYTPPVKEPYTSPGEAQHRPEHTTSEQTKRTRGRRAVGFPTALAFDEALAAWTTSNCPDIDGPREFDKFRDHHLAKGSTFVDWRRAFYTWARKAQEWAEERKPRPDERGWR